MSESMHERKSRASIRTSGQSAGMTSAWRTDSSPYRCEPGNALTATMKGTSRLSKKSIAAKQSWTRRRSTMTTAPTAPLVRSSHMNQKRDCPGVPNRYSMSCSSTVMRPKSIATVVVVLSGTALVSSIPRDSTVICCSVVSGVISETDPTKVVLPTPNPPATRIFSGMISRSATGGCATSACAKSIQQPPENCLAGSAVRGRRSRQVHDQVSGVHQVPHQDPGYTDRDLELRRDLGQRQRSGAHHHDRP